MTARLTRTLIAAACLSGTAMAHAGDASDAKSAFAVSGNVTMTTNYIWRGLSQTWGKPAQQATVTVDHASGAYFGFFASNVAPQFVPNANLETDWSLGYKTKAGAADLDVGGVYIYYPGGNFNKASFSPSFNSSVPHTVELYASAAANGFGLRVGYIPTAFFGWNENNSGVNGVFNGEQPQAGLTGKSKGSVNVEASYTATLKEGWSLQAAVGHQKLPNSVDLSWSYGRVGVTADVGQGWSANLMASFTSQPKAFKSYGSLTNNGQRSNPASNAVVASLSKAF